MTKNRVVAVIPAREGSKRLANKNLLSLAGKPLIAWTIEAALECDLIDDVIVSTDSESIKQIAIGFGATVPFLRPSHLADDYASTDDVLMHSIEKLKLSSSDTIVLLQPTSPLRDSLEIRRGISELNNGLVQGVVSVCECEHSPLWSNTLPKGKLMGGFIRENVSSRSQDLPIHYRLNGAIYAYKVGFLREFKGREYSNDIKAIEMSPEKSVDIDTRLDFMFAEFLIKKGF